MVIGFLSIWYEALSGLFRPAQTNGYAAASQRPCQRRRAGKLLMRKGGGRSPRGRRLEQVPRSNIGVPVQGLAATARGAGSATRRRRATPDGERRQTPSAGRRRTAARRRNAESER